MNALIALIFFLSAPFLLVILTRVLEYIYLWQVKEYRLDRVISHLKYEGSWSYSDEFSISIRVSVLITLLMYYLSPLSSALAIALIVALVFYSFNAFDDLHKILHKKMRRPSLKSPRNILILFSTLIVIALPFAYILFLLNQFNAIPVFQNIVIDNINNPANVFPLNMQLAVKTEDIVIVSLPIYLSIFAIASCVAIDLAIPLITTVFVYLTAPLSILKRKYIIWKAKRKMSSITDLVVIAVTGSYGKTTTKEILYQMISKNFVTVKTEKNNNTEVGIAQTILNKINNRTEVFVAEMGAYKLGETLECTKIAKPSIAIITGIDEQHISLYGSFKAIIDSTMEIVDGLKPEGVVILNGDNEYCMRLATLIKARKILYFTNQFQNKIISPQNSSKKKEVENVEFPHDENMYISNVEQEARGLSFTLAYKNYIQKIKTNIKAKHNIGNIVAAILSASELGLDIEEIVKLVNEMDFELPYLAIKPAANNSQLIDDGYNINPSGYYAGIKFLSEQKIKGKKWVITQGFTELGEERANTYKAVATATVKSADGIITSDLFLYESIKDEDDKFKAVYVENIFDLPVIYRRDIQTGDMVLIEGPLPGQVLNNIQGSK
jgi:UDP-N-acetylmuramoyl-tripeptide--D-alanyl-D-alanine ligase